METITLEEEVQIVKAKPKILKIRSSLLDLYHFATRLEGSPMPYNQYIRRLIQDTYRKEGGKIYGTQF